MVTNGWAWLSRFQFFLLLLLLLDITSGGLYVSSFPWKIFGVYHLPRLGDFPTCLKNFMGGEKIDGKVDI